ncbi:MAG: hypothetical protein E3J72_15320 [Planctomycetota bacterium]|nr:MAG: hypothetical protein E3J72_15320 [Planctomycetota bacterium]
MRRRLLSGLVLFTVILFAAAAVSADTIVLKSGRTLEGTIIAENDREVTLRQAGGVTSIPRASIDEIRRSPTVDDYFGKRASIKNPDDPKEHLELAEWCVENGFSHMAEIEYRTVLRLEPDNTDAREALGYVRYGGRWLSEERVAGIRAGGERSSPGEPTEEESSSEEESAPAEPESSSTPDANPRRLLTGSDTIPAPVVGSVSWEKAYSSKSKNIHVYCNVSHKAANLYATLMKNLFTAYGKVITGTVRDSAPRELNVYSDVALMKEITAKPKKKELVWYNTSAKRVEAVHDWRGTVGQTPKLLAYEGVYLYADRIMRNVYGAPKWLLVGLGSYFAGATIDKRGKVGRILAPRDRLIRMKKAYTGGYQIKLDYLMLRPRYKYGRNEYDTSWAVIYYLLESGRKGRTAFAKIFEKGCTGKITAADLEDALGFDIPTFEMKIKAFIQKKKIPSAGRVSGDGFDVSAYGFTCTRPSKSWKFNTDVKDADTLAELEYGDARIIIRAVPNAEHYSHIAVTNAVIKLIAGGYSRLERRAVRVGRPALQGYSFSYSSKDIIGGSSGGADAGKEVKNVLIVTADYDFRYGFEFQAPADKYEELEKEFQTFLASINFTTRE